MLNNERSCEITDKRQNGIISGNGNIHGNAAECNRERLLGMFFSSTCLPRHFLTVVVVAISVKSDVTNIEPSSASSILLFISIYIPFAIAMLSFFVTIII